MARNWQTTDEFYIGYVSRMPPNLARRMARTIGALAVLALATGLGLVLAQHPFAQSMFEYGQYRDFSGIIELKPYPALLVSRPGAVGTRAAYSRYLLAAMGKHGADACTSGFDGQHVTVRGSLIYRGGDTMIEILPGSVSRERSDAAIAAKEAVLGKVALTGEIVDSKCYLGVMNPGQTKVHRDCAARCISGGIPPAFVTRDGFYLLTGSDGRKLNREVLDFAGETIRVQGVAVRSGDTLILRTEPASFVRVTGS